MLWSKRAEGRLKQAVRLAERSLELYQQAGDDLFPLEIGPELHGNHSILYYIVASDRSGHQAFFGSPDAPFEIERVKWFKKVIPN